MLLLLGVRASATPRQGFGSALGLASRLRLQLGLISPPKTNVAGRDAQQQREQCHAAPVVGVE
jgi:hypothetical protein